LTNNLTYLRLQNNADPDEIEYKLKEYDMTIGSKIWSFHIWPLLDVHFKGIGNRKGESDIRYIYIFSATAVFLMFLACFNYMNLSTSQSATRAKEIGIRKVLSAQISNITWLLSKEFLFLVVIANIIAWPAAPT